MTVKVLIIDDSATARVALRMALEREDDIRVVGELPSGAKAVKTIERLKPDLVTMDVFLGSENGLDVTAEIMRDAPRPILVITAANPKDPALAYRALASGALEVMAKLPSVDRGDYERRRDRLVRSVRTLSRVPVVRRRRTQGQRPARSAKAPRKAGPTPAPGRSAPPPEEGAAATSRRVDVVVVGASTGGPSTVAEILGAVPSLRVPLVLVQHIMVGFGDGYARWLAQSSGHRVETVLRRVKLEPGVVYVASDESHVEVLADRWARPVAGPPRSHQRPSVDVLFEAAARHYGERALGVLLTGMGKDGAAGLKAMHEAGATTLAQLPESCTVDSMPRAAIALDAVTRIEAPDDIARALRRLGV